MEQIRKNKETQILSMTSKMLDQVRNTTFFIYISSSRFEITYLYSIKFQLS